MWKVVGREGEGREGGNGKYDTTGTPPTPRRGTPSASPQGYEHGGDSGSSAFLATRTRGGSASLRAPPAAIPPGTRFPLPGETVSGGVASAAPGGDSLAGMLTSASQPRGNASSGTEAISEPRCASLEGSGNSRDRDGIARLELARLQNPRYSSRAGLRRPLSSSLVTSSPAAVVTTAANNDGREGSKIPPRSNAARRWRGSGGDGFGLGKPEKGEPATTAAADPRVPKEDFEVCGGGNFAVFLAVRRVSIFGGSLSGSSGGESGFEMLVRLALKEAHHFVLASFTYWRPGAEWRSRRGRSGNNQSQGVAGKDGNRRQGSMRFWDVSAAGRSNSLSSTSGVGVGIGNGTTQLSAVVAGPPQISMLVTAIIRDNFLAQVRNGSIRPGSAI